MNKTQRYERQILLNPQCHRRKYKYTNKKKTKNSINKMNKQNIFSDLYFWAREVRMLFDYKCAYCGTSRKLSAHHIFYKSKYPGLKYNISNSILLCQKCHDELHQLNDIVVVNDQDKDTISINQ